MGILFHPWTRGLGDAKLGSREKPYDERLCRVEEFLHCLCRVSIRLFKKACVNYGAQTYKIAKSVSPRGNSERPWVTKSARSLRDLDIDISAARD